MEPSAQDPQGPLGAGPETLEGWSTSLWGKAEAGVVQPGGQKALGTPYSRVLEQETS